MNSLATIKVLKSVLLAFVVLTVASCGGGGGDTPANEGFGNSDSELEGFWVLTDLNNQPTLPDRAYLLTENASSSDIQISFFSLRTNTNCFDRLVTERVVKVSTNPNRYQDIGGDFLTMTVQGNVFTLLLDLATIPDQVQSYQTVVGLSVQDLPLCTTASNSNRKTSGLIEHMLEAVQY